MTRAELRELLQHIVSRKSLPVHEVPRVAHAFAREVGKAEDTEQIRRVMAVIYALVAPGVRMNAQGQVDVEGIEEDARRLTAHLGAASKGSPYLEASFVASSLNTNTIRDIL
jgi:orotidine-5'-phosphate decarboxylase